MSRGLVSPSHHCRQHTSMMSSSISHTPSNSPCLWGTLGPVLVDFSPILGRFWHRWRIANHRNAVLCNFRVSNCILACIPDPRWAMNRPTLSNAPWAWCLGNPWREQARSLPEGSLGPISGLFLADSFGYFRSRFFIHRLSAGKYECTRGSVSMFGRPQ
jgi:hypothetical protein